MDHNFLTRGIIALWIAMISLTFTCEGRAQVYGASKIAVDGQLYNYLSTGSVAINEGEPQTCDIFEGGWILQPNYTVYNTTNGDNRDTPDFVMIGMDGAPYFGTAHGVILITPQRVSTVNPTAGLSYPDFWNGTAWVSKWAFDQYTVFQVDDSPAYFNPHDSSDFVIDATQGWPVSNIFSAPPQQMYVNGRVYNIQSNAPVIEGTYFGETVYYANPLNGDWAQIFRLFHNGLIESGEVAGFLNGQNFTGTFDPASWGVQGLPSEIAISFSAPSGTPAYGPPLVSWYGKLLSFYYTTPDGKDLYWNAGEGLESDLTVIVASDGSADAMFSTISATGTYASPGVFDFQGVDGTAGIIAQDANGNPFPGELGLGITFLFRSSGLGQQILDGYGSVYSPLSYLFYPRPDGSWGLKYINLPDGVYLVQDENGNYTAPPYKFASGAGDTIVNAINGWPATNIFPQQIYINGILCSKVAGSQYDSGAGLPRNGGVSYRASAYDLTVVLSWYWDAQTNFQGFVNGKYGQSSSFKGNWDGLGNFSNMTNGAVASVTPPTSVPTDGNPPQVAVNGSALTYDSVASTALANAGTPGDVYMGLLGQSLTIYQNGTVSYTPGTGVAAITGTYNAGTHQFNFGSGNTVDFGNGNTAVVTATDTGGHNLAILNANTNGGGVTELFGGLDVHGNTFSLGTWASGAGESLYAFGLAYADNPGGQPPSLLGFSTTRSAVNWLWSHPSTDGGQDQVNAMVLDSAHRLILYDPAHPANANIVLDPGGASGFHGPIRIRPQGDISMGGFQSSPVTPP